MLARTSIVSLGAEHPHRCAASIILVIGAIDKSLPEAEAVRVSASSNNRFIRRTSEQTGRDDRFASGTEIRHESASTREQRVIAGVDRVTRSVPSFPYATRYTQLARNVCTGALVACRAKRLPALRNVATI